MPEYYTYKRDVPLRPGERLGFTPGRGYYSIPAPKAAPLPASSKSTPGGSAQKHPVQPKPAVRSAHSPQHAQADRHPAQPTHAASSRPGQQGSIHPIQPTHGTAALRPPQHANLHPVQPRHAGSTAKGDRRGIIARAHPAAAATEIARWQTVAGWERVLSARSGSSSEHDDARRRSRYVSPFRLSRNIVSGRVDQGVDFHGTGPIVSIGDAVVVDDGGTGWPGGPGTAHGSYLLLRLTSGPDAGRHVDIAEGFTPTVRRGQRVKAGQIIGHFSANAAPGRFPGIEIGWGSSTLNLTQAAATTGYVEGEQTASGKSFARLLESLGAYKPR